VEEGRYINRKVILRAEGDDLRAGDETFPFAREFQGSSD
jgi:hypothetical protein